MMQRISKEELLLRLEAVLGQPVGMRGLDTLLYGWKRFRKYGSKYLDALKHRDWLYIVEVMDFSDYAGYDLTKSETAHLCEVN
jgi:hypothetical protein